MKWIALTGGIACGKSTVSDLLRKQGVVVIDADHIAHKVVQKGTPGLMSVVTAFGPEVLDESGNLDRKKMADKIFHNQKQREQLEAILHPLIRQEVQKQRQELQKQGFPFAVYDIPLLFETKSQGQFDKVIVVTCHPEQQIERLRKRNSLKEEEIQKRLASQIPSALKEAQADFIVSNTVDLQHLEAEVNRLVQWLKSL